MFDNPYFGLVLTFLAWVIGLKVQKRFKSPLVNPLLIAVAIIIASLLILDVPYDSYIQGASYYSFLVGPATVALVVSLYKNLHHLKGNLIPVFGGILVGVVVALSSVLVCGKIFGLTDEMVISALPQSVTLAIAIPVTTEYAGIPAIAAIMVSTRGAIGLIVSPYLVKLARIKDPIAIGTAFGTAFHAFGTAKAAEVSELAGAIGGMSLALTGVLTTIILPFFVKFV